MKKPQPKHPLSQLHLPLPGLAPIKLPDGRDQQLIQALIELLLSAVVEPAATLVEPAATPGEKHE
jgi:hypothetical protein